MSVSLNIWAAAGMQVNSQGFLAGSLHRAITLSLTGNVHDRTEAIANAANAALYSDELGTFGFLYVASDQDVRILVTDNTSASMSFTVKGTATANKQGVPFMLGDDQTSNTSARINSVQVFNVSGSTANVRCFIVE
jgi:hypothetical protein